MIGCSIGSDLAQEHNIEVEVGTRGTEPEHLRKYLGIAERMGAHLVRTMGGWHKAPAPLDEIKTNFRQVLPQFSNAGVRIALENYEAYSTSDIAAIPCARLTTPLWEFASI